MQFHLDETQLALQDTIRGFCADRFSLARVAERESRSVAGPVWRELAEMGVFAVLAGDDGLGPVEAAIVFEEFGAHVASGPLVWSALGAASVGGVTSGAVRVTGMVAAATQGLPTVVSDLDESDVVLVVHPDRIVSADRAAVSSEPGSSIDPLTPMSVMIDLPSGRNVGDAEAAAALRMNGAILHAASLVGTARGALEVAQSYALEREQFGVPIGSFQAVKHLLADMYVRVEMARAETYAAAALAASDLRTRETSRAVSAAKYLAGEAGIANGRAAVQILGGMGFTWEMLPHYFLKRSWVLEQGFGTGASHAAELGRSVGEEVATR